MSNSIESESDLTKNTTKTETAATTTNKQAAIVEMSSKKIESEIHKEYLELVETLKTRSRVVRERLEQTHCRTMSDLRPGPNEARVIDQNAAQFMRTFVTQKHVEKPSERASNRQQQQLQHQAKPLQIASQPKTPATTATEQQQQNAATTKSKRKPRRALVQEVEALQDLIKDLALHSPEIRTRISQLVQKSDVLTQLDIFSAEAPTCSSRVAQQQQQQENQKSVVNCKNRHVSEVSNTSNNNGKRDELKNKVTTTADVNGCIAIASDDSGAGTRKTRKRSKKQNKNDKSNLNSELVALRAYINQIVLDFMGVEQLPPDMEFTGDFCDLETHARHLANAGLGRIVEDEIRINKKNNRQSFITMSTDREGMERDGMVLLPVARRYAFEGDVVRAFVLNPGISSSCDENPKVSQNTIIGGKQSISLADDEELSEETESDTDIDANDLESSVVVTQDNCPKAFVITVVKQTELRQIVGIISFTNPVKLCGDRMFYKLKPHDMRVPMVYVPVESCATIISKENNTTDICGLLYLAHILETDQNGHCIAELLQPVGRVGNLEAEIKAILLHNGLRDIVPFEERFNEMFAQTDIKIDAATLTQRMDLRKKCIFTIDPLTARDLDDALSVERLNYNGEYEVGVHISDVSHYLQENSELDNIVKERATSIYLVNEVIHMLPKTLCFKCSLLPGEDKFAFSVFWTMNVFGKVIGKPRFSRTIINSCTQFAYEHAQKIIDNPDEKFGVDDFPTITNGYSPNDIKQRVQLLHVMAREMRKRRYENGALSINNPKLRFTVDPVTGEPKSFEVEKLREANHMIEEFMLLANQAVARFIYDNFPDTAVLRNHAPPLTKSLKSLREKLNAIGLELDYSSSKALQESMQRLCTETNDPVAINACLSQLLMKPMARAKYFCSEGKSEGAELWHYALNIPIYTHFTSPIRRYPDILVHRFLAAALDYCPEPLRTAEELHLLTKIANDRKYSAKLAGDDSVNLFFKRYVQAKQNVQVRAVVMEIFTHTLNVVTLETGHVLSINYKMQKVLVDTTNAPNSIYIAERNSKMQPRKLQLFSTVDIRLVIWNNKLCGFFVSPDLAQRQLNSKETSFQKKKLLHPLTGQPISLARHRHNSDTLYRTTHMNNTSNQNTADNQNVQNQNQKCFNKNQKKTPTPKQVQAKVKTMPMATSNATIVTYHHHQQQQHLRRVYAVRQNSV